MNETGKTPFEPFFDEIRRIVREEIRAFLDGGLKGHSEGLLTLEEAGKRFSVPKTWLSEAARRGDLPHVRLGHYVRLREQDLVEFIAKNRVEKKRA